MFLKPHRVRKDGKTHVYGSLVESYRTAHGPRHQAQQGTGRYVGVVMESVDEDRLSPARDEAPYARARRSSERLNTPFDLCRVSSPTKRPHPEVGVSQKPWAGCFGAAVTRPAGFLRGTPATLGPKFRP